MGAKVLPLASNGMSLVYIEVPAGLAKSVIKSLSYKICFRSLKEK